MTTPLDKQRSGSRLAQSKLLVIEDNNDQWALISSALSQSIPEVDCVRVSSANEAITLLDSWSTQEWELPKLILQDLYLPQREDGWHLLTAIKALPMPVNHIPVVVFSSSNHRPDIEGTYQRGAAGYVVKPFEVDEWRTYFDELRAYWWDTIALPPLQFGFL
ncbi:response regulator [Spirosoma rhododendri]|uniref:Response regulator n=1 Tax=Spirosoma rhododendri TaxID=2728024 RepID=A0A7L5DMG1_9BACT|nr:response regulator [Spirosoma rhododendri]QJD79664.1 response regulator [Spirosoma rhododendri]